MNLVIGTFNVKDHGDSTYDKIRSKVIWDLVKKYKIDILSLQEITPTLIIELKDIFNKHNYYVTEAFRESKKLNESNTIISRSKPIKSKTLWLSNEPEVVGSKSFSSLFPRNVNITDLEPNIKVLNTHLDLFSYTRIKQLECLFSIINQEKDDNYLFLMGDFNTKTHRKYFINFINKLDKIGLKRVNNNLLTCKAPILPYYNGTIDHIFISKQFNIINSKVIDTEISDHKLFITKIELIKK